MADRNSHSMGGLFRPGVYMLVRVAQTPGKKHLPPIARMPFSLCWKCGKPSTDPSTLSPCVCVCVCLKGEAREKERDTQVQSTCVFERAGNQ
jgi:hypothetical protein